MELEEIKTVDNLSSTIVNYLNLKSIDELLDKNFFIPSYQRGYRWSEKQVEALLKDIWEFRNKNPKIDEFYCLQPVVVTLNKVSDVEQWELIDGQQRLTTIFIILSYFNKRFTEEFRKPIFSLHYKTRENSLVYLQNINEIDKDKNIDYHFIYEAYETIKKWFSTRQNYINDFESMLLNNTKVIWYEVNDSNSNPIDIFTRINIGKIPLTNAELVKALFLQKDNFAQQSSLKQLQIATEWDTIEKKLQDNSFWYFIYSPKNSIAYENRIEYIFDLIQEKKKEDEDFFTFNKFHKEFEKNKEENGILKIDPLWLKIKKYFLSLEEWYNDRDLYHLIGFLIEYKYDINKLKSDSDGLNKSKYKSFLKEEINKLFKNIDIDTLEYGGKDNYSIKMTLLLFNIQTIIATQKAEMRFPFDKYKEENWDIEHIKSQTDKTITKANRKDWALDILEYYTGQNGYSTVITDDNEKTTKEIQIELAEKLNEKEKDFAVRLINLLDQEKTDDDYFQNLYDELSIEFKESDFDQDDNISNLALLDETTNRSYGNAMFPIKRRRIIENDMNGIFVPICTKNLFLKYYSKKLSNVMHWQERDASDYLEAIKKLLKEYLSPQL